jgi:hypothetical protein
MFADLRQQNSANKNHALQVPQRRRLLAVLQGCVLFERKNQAPPLHLRRQEGERPEAFYYLHHQKN